MSDPYVPKTAMAILVALELSKQHARWFVSEHPNYKPRTRNFLRKVRRFRIRCDKGLSALLERHPKWLRFLGLVACAFGIVVLMGIATVVVGGAAAFLYNVGYGDPIESGNLTHWRFFLGWTPVLLAGLHLWFLTFSAFAGGSQKQPQRPFLQTPLPFWFAITLATLFTIPIWASATNIGFFVLATWINVLVVFVASRAVAQVGLWIIARRANLDLAASKKRSNLLLYFMWVLGALLFSSLLIFAGVNTSGTNYLKNIDFQVELGSIVHLLEAIAQGNMPWWIAGLISLGGICIWVKQSSVAKKQSSFSYRRRLVLGSRYNPKVPIEKLQQLECDSSNLVNQPEVSQAIARDFANHRSATKSLFRSLREFDPLTLFFAPWFLIVYLVFGAMAWILSTLEIDSNHQLGINSIILTYLIFLSSIFGIMEGISLLSYFRKKICPDAARPISDWAIWLETQSEGVIVFAQSLLLSIPVIVMAGVFRGWGWHLLLGLGALLLAHVAIRNLFAAFRIGAGWFCFLPTWITSDVGSIMIVVGTATTFGLLALTRKAIASYGLIGIVFLSSVVLLISFAFFGLVILVKNRRSTRNFANGSVS